jgi:hypothetical protein
MLQGAVAQLGERLVCNQEATGSIPVSSTNLAIGRLDQSDDVYETRLDPVSWDCRISVRWRNWYRRCRVPILVKLFDKRCSKCCCYRRVGVCGSWGIVGRGSFSLLDRDSPAQTTNVMLGVKFNNRESVHGQMKVVLTPNIGLEATQTRSGGSASASWRGRTLTTE